MKPKLDSTDVSQVAYEWYNNVTEKVWLNANSAFKRDNKHYYKRKQCSVDIFALFIGEKIPKGPNLRREVLPWNKLTIAVY